jgi:hypothetical protein
MLNFNTSNQTPPKSKSLHLIQLVYKKFGIINSKLQFGFFDFGVHVKYNYSEDEI